MTARDCKRLWETMRAYERPLQTRDTMRHYCNLRDYERPERPLDTRETRETIGDLRNYERPERL